MNIFKGNDEEKNKKIPYDKILSERDKIKGEIKVTLTGLGLNPPEIDEVLSIVDVAQDKIEKLKESLIGTNINQDPTEIQKKVYQEIQQIMAFMNIDLKRKVEDILKK